MHNTLLAFNTILFLFVGNRRLGLYTREEEQAMLKFIVEKEAHAYCFGTEIWKIAEKLKVL